MATAEPMDMHTVRATYEASAPIMAVEASKAYVRTLAEHQDAAMAGDPDAIRSIHEARALFALAAPEVVETQRYADPEPWRMHARRYIA
ncbi:hypothetical protein [Streptomyces albicerus]|uniref:hypothetical protein n=1 Tax=Streptomyces albicerus TaxID=2569859 RepID=UPI00124B9498|nr:hypothetical protein [Streptomyces albicerus]